MPAKEIVDPDAKLRSVLAQIAPGTALRDGLQRILRGSTGALVILGYDKTVGAISTGGFKVDIEFSATRLRELPRPVIGRIHDDRLLLDLRCLEEPVLLTSQLSALQEALA